MNATATITTTTRIDKAALQAEINRLHKRRTRFISLVVALAIVAALAAASMAVFARPMQVNGMSMEPTLSTGDLLLVDARRTTPTYGDVVVFTVDTLQGLQLVKRVVGLPGDVIDMDPASGQFYRNGNAISEPYVEMTCRARQADTTSFPTTVPAGHLFVLGDNRQSSIDSRCNEVGMVPMQNLIGSVWSGGNLLKAGK